MNGIVIGNVKCKRPSCEGKYMQWAKFKIRERCVPDYVSYLPTCPCQWTWTWTNLNPKKSTPGHFWPYHPLAPIMFSRDSKNSILSLSMLTAMASNETEEWGTAFIHSALLQVLPFFGGGSSAQVNLRTARPVSSRPWQLYARLSLVILVKTDIAGSERRATREVLSTKKNMTVILDSYWRLDCRHRNRKPQ